MKLQSHFVETLFVTWVLAYSCFYFNKNTNNIHLDLPN
jgi:hypothetical protein